MVAPDLRALIAELPWVELHVHIEGALEPELAFTLAERNGLSLPYRGVDELRAAYRFSDLQSFLDLYYALTDVLRTERDFYDLARGYFERAAAAGVVHAELFFDPQSHVPRGVPLEAVIGGLRGAIDHAARAHGLSAYLIMCFLRHLPEREANATLDAARPLLGELVAVGLDSSELDHPPANFERVFARARALGLRAVAHAGEEGPAAYIAQALDRLHVDRIDHGIRCLESPALVERLARSRVPLTVCPLSNVALRVVDDLGSHPLLRLLDHGLCATINSDDPAYFGGYLDANLTAVCDALPVEAEHLRRLARNAIEASFLPVERKAELQAAVLRAV